VYRRRGAYQSFINVTFGVGSALGSALGGAMAEALGWRWEFGVQIPPLLLCIGVSAVAIPADLGVVECGRERKGVWAALREFDARGSLLLTGAISFLILGLVSAVGTLASGKMEGRLYEHLGAVSRASIALFLSLKFVPWM